MSAVEILREARALIADESRWTQGDYARDASGLSVTPTADTATCWCAIGALEKVCGPEEGLALFNSAYEFLYSAAMSMYRDGVAAVNDQRVHLLGSTAHAAVLELYDEAVMKAEARNA